ncbi:MAG: class I SAM-dependent methyltransferase [Anaerolineae bacterium]|nr:class I SAM-dependent methyltransferase [Anaerolineae bacterium]
MTRALTFELRYLLGTAPWDTGVVPPEVVELVERGALPPGRALDLGCGTGTSSLYLARHGWEVVGVDFSFLAIRRARRRARRERLPVRFHRADVTHLPFLREPFDLVLDIGCLHGLPPEDRKRYAAEVHRLTRPGGLYLLYAFLPRPGRPRSIAPEEVVRLFPAFVLERREAGTDPSGPPAAWYWLRKR